MTIAAILGRLPAEAQGGSEAFFSAAGAANPEVSQSLRVTRSYPSVGIVPIYFPICTAICAIKSTGLRGLLI